MIGNPLLDNAGIVWLINSKNWLVLRRFLTFSCETIIVPAFPSFSFPPTWSGCK